MKKQLMGLTIAVLTIATLAGCGTKAAATAPANNTTAPVQKVSDKDQAANVVKEYLTAEGSFTSKDPSTYTAIDQFMTSDVAKGFHKDMSNFFGILTSDKGAMIHETPTVTFVAQKGTAYAFEGKMTMKEVSVSDPKKVLSSKDILVDVYYEVTKQSNGTFLISYSNDESNMKK